MIVVYVAVQTQEAAASEFERIISEIQQEVLAMPGCVKNEWYRHPALARRYMMYGEFASREQFEVYMNSTSVQRIRQELMPLLAAPPEFKHYEAHLLDGN